MTDTLDTTAAGTQLLAAVDPLTLQAAAIADQGPVDPEAIPCHVCGVPAAIHVVPVLVLADVVHAHEVPPAYTLAIAALAGVERKFMDDIVQGLAAEYRPSGNLGPSPSDAGTCRRQLWYRQRPPADYVPRTGIDEKRAAIGSLFHRAGEKYRPAIYPWRRFEMVVEIPGLSRRGRIDEYDPVLGLVIDTKTAGRAKWGMIGDDGPTPQMWAQLLIYAWSLYLAGYPVKTLCIIAINRDTGDEEHHYLEFDPAAGAAALDELTTVASMIDAGLVPPRDGHGTQDWQCKWCPAMDHCWSTARAAELGRSPESLTLLGEDPDDDAIIWAALEFLRLREQRLALDKQESRAKALLQGLPTRKYGEAREAGGIEIADSWSSSTAYKQAYERLLQLYVLPDGERPPLEEVPPPAVTKSRSQTAKKIRAAKRAATKRKTTKTKAEKAADAVTAMTEGQVPQ